MKQIFRQLNNSLKLLAPTSQITKRLKNSVFVFTSVQQHVVGWHCTLVSHTSEAEVHFAHLTQLMDYHQRPHTGGPLVPYVVPNFQTVLHPADV